MEIKVKRFDEVGVYYVVVPIGAMSDKFEFCKTYEIENDVLALQEATESMSLILN